MGDKKDYWDDPIMAAKRIAFKDVYMPEDLKGKIEIYIKKNGAVAIRNIKMEKITGKELRKLGFKKELEESSEDKYHYYTYDVDDDCLLISNANNERVDGGYEVTFFEFNDLKFCDLNDLKKLVKLLKKASNG
jgi:hypothetical protein